MPTVALFNIKGEQIGEVALKEEVFGIEPNEAVVHQAVVNQLASMRQGNHNTKSRGEVAGGGKKPWRQKGTGRARAGTIRSPLWRGGAITFGPKPRAYGFVMPKKMRRLALKSALSSKVANGEFLVVDALSLTAPKTKEMVAVLKALQADNKALVVTAEADETVFKAARNIPGVLPMEATGLNVYDLLNCDKVLITKDAVAKVEEVLA